MIVYKSNKDFEIVEVEPTHETRDILGYTCKKVIATTKQGPKLEVYYTEAIKPVTMDGLPLAYSLQTPEANVVFEATDIKEGGVNASAFNYSIPRRI